MSGHNENRRDEPTRPAGSPTFAAELPPSHTIPCPISPHQNPIVPSGSRRAAKRRLADLEARNWNEEEIMNTTQATNQAPQGRKPQPELQSQLWTNRHFGAGCRLALWRRDQEAGSQRRPKPATDPPGGTAQGNAMRQIFLARLTTHGHDCADCGFVPQPAEGAMLTVYVPRGTTLEPHVVAGSDADSGGCGLARPVQSDAGRGQAGRAAGRDRGPDPRGDAGNRDFQPSLCRERRALHDRDADVPVGYRPSRSRRRSPSSCRASG